MKTIYEAKYPLGFDPHEVKDDHPVTLPFVDVKPLEGLANEQSQFFNFTVGKWEEAITQDLSKKLALVENLHEGLKTDNAALKESNELLKQELAETQMDVTNTQIGLAEVYEIALGGKA